MLKNISLEMSLKPFKQTDDSFIENVCKTLFEQWKPLLKNAAYISILLWSADGSELLDYRGNLHDEFEWAYFIGGANQREDNHSDIDPDGIELHSRNYLYRNAPPRMTYQILKNIIAALKRTGQELFEGRQIRVGTTIDPGPEFAKSAFKYERHNEICRGNAMGKKTMICAHSSLKKDSYPYAAYPDGIPEGLSFGTFLGKQANLFLKDMDFDYIWFSNGLGFGAETWSTTGSIFDGNSFHFEKLEQVKKAVMQFWQDFRRECPDYPIETRGTNMSMGIDFASDGVPLQNIYDGGYQILPPPNSPWAALNGNFGLELMGHMSRIAHVPDEDYIFRYYIHDPWWANSPWYDRYNGQPHDIYLPLSIVRLDGCGKVKTPTHINLLTIDNSFGDLPDSCVYEPLPHLLKALKETPDDIAPFVWIYPFREYSACNTEQGIREMFSGDWFICNAINSGLPLSMVVSTDNFLKQDKKMYASSILISAVPGADSDFETQILSYVKNGGKVIFYGNTIRAGKNFINMAGIKHSDGISGKLKVFISGKYCGKMKHHSSIGGGDIFEEAVEGKVIARAENKVIAACKDNFAWLRGAPSCDFMEGSQLPSPHKESEYFISETLMLHALTKFGFHIGLDKKTDIPAPVIMLHRHNNAYIFSCYLANTTVKTSFRFPLGAPVLDGYETQLEDGNSTYYFPKAERRECRVFVDQPDGIVGCRELPPVSFLYRRRIEVSGLVNATVRFLPENYCKDNIHVVVNTPCVDFFSVGDDFDGEYVQKGNLTFYEARGITGKVVFSLPRISG
ncbi:hypothetical protein AALB47_02880 [Lachnospiraceae bacterium 54-11]